MKKFDPNLLIINKYKSIVTADNKKEIYKWVLMNKYQGRPDLAADDFVKEVTSINYQNLIYHNAMAVRNILVKELPEAYKKCYEFLFDESIDLHERIVNFQIKIKELYRSLGYTLQTHHDERSISTFLSFKYPEKYPLYKKSVYVDYCKKIGVLKATINRRYEHYIQLINDFISNYIEQDAELLSLKAKFLTADCYADPAHLLFAQDILFQGLNVVDSDDYSDDSEEEVLINNTMPLNKILYGPPGTGKTYNTINKAVAIANPTFDLSQDRAIVKAEYKRLVDAGQIVFTTFHQSMSYEDFVEGIKPIIDVNGDGNKQVVYEVKDGVFKNIVTKAKELSVFNKYRSIGNFQIRSISDETIIVEKPRGGVLSISKNLLKDFLMYYKNIQGEYTSKNDLKEVDRDVYPWLEPYIVNGYDSLFKEFFKIYNDHDCNAINEKPHVLIIDEINRGNVSAIFGELITLLEDSKRAGNDEALEVTLPYSKEKFSVPQNLYIIGTMNTADRSVEALDTALRRRFVFEEMLPKPELLKQSLYGYPASAILERINLRIEKLIDRDHCIGHAYFLHKDEDSIIDSFYKNIIPLLQEYFFGDYGKIGLVLGKGFIQVKESKSTLFADFAYDYKEDLENRTVYEIIDYRRNGEVDKEGFKAAIGSLMNNG